MKKSQLKIADILEPFMSEEFEDTLSEDTKKARRNLLASSLISVLITVAGLTPTEISMLGISFGEVEINRLLIVLFLVVLYFIANFSLYSLADYQIRKVVLNKRKLKSREHVKAFGEESKKLKAMRIDQNNLKEILEDPKVNELLSAGEVMKTIQSSDRVVRIRLIFDVWFPIMLGASALTIVGASAIGVDLFFLILGTMTLFSIGTIIYMVVKRDAIRRSFQTRKNKWYRKKVRKISENLKKGVYDGERAKTEAERAKTLLFRSMGLDLKHEKNAGEK